MWSAGRARGARARVYVSLATVSALLITGLGGASLAQQAAPEPPPDYARDIVPIVEANCLRCHSAAEQEGGLLLDTYEDMMRGGDTGAPVAAGNAEESLLVRLVERRQKPHMPPKRVLAAAEIAMLRAWIEAGAKPSTLRPPSLDGRVPSIAPKTAVRPAISALAFRPDGRELAVGGYREVRRLTWPGGASAGQVSGLQDLARAVEYSPDGRLLAIAGGIPGAYGELVIADAATGAHVRALAGHRDYVYAVAFSPDGARLASCGYDRTVRVWDVETGRVLHVLREHTEAVFGVAFSADGTRLASASADRSVKIWDVTTGARLYTLTDATDALSTVTFHPTEPRVSAAGADKTIRTWVLEAAGGRQVQAYLAHTSGVLRLRYSADGTRLASSAMDASVKLWDADAGTELRTFGTQSDWPQGLAWSPDGRALAVGRHDGSLTIYDAATGAVVVEPALRAGLPASRAEDDRP